MLSAGRKALIEALILLTLIQILPGCAAMMAGAGESWSRRQTRADVEALVGKPLSTASEPDGRQTAVYEYSRRRPSADWARFHASMWGQTFGLWDIFGVPIEAVRDVMHRERVRLTVTYAPDDRVIGMSESVLARRQEDKK